MKITIHRASERGEANHGWLKSFHSFSFAEFYDPKKMNFGALRVLNDDYVAASMGFSTHPHKNMEIVSIPLSGELRHKDSMGNTTVIKPGEVQIMSAGTGVHHSEMNNSVQQPVKFLQIWVIPEQQNLAPRYDQQFFDKNDRQEVLQVIVSPLKSPDKGVKINQNAWFSRIDLSDKKSFNYSLNQQGNGVYVFLLTGQVKINETVLSTRDAIGLEEIESLEILAEEASELLIIEVPM